MKKLALYISSLFIVAFGQPAWVAPLGIVASSLGFALFWVLLLSIPDRMRRLGLASLWFLSVQAVQLSWMTSTVYMGPLIWIVYFFLIAVIGLQFGLLSLWITPCVSISSLLAMASLWVYFEWMRLFFLDGFTWSFVGLSLAGPLPSLSWVSLFGLFGLSFWVIWVNGLAFKTWQTRSKRVGTLWLICALLPYAWGIGMRYTPDTVAGPPLSVFLVQTHFSMEEKFFTKGEESSFIPLAMQWEHLLELLPKKGTADLIVLPESTMAYGAFRPIYSYREMKQIWVDQWGPEGLTDLPELQEPLAEKMESGGRFFWKVSNAFWAQAIANHYGAALVAGFDDFEEKTGNHYAAAFYFQPHHAVPHRYEKRALVPIGEYIPCAEWGWVRAFVAQHFGITDSFQRGTEAKVFPLPAPFGISLCCEETYSALMRDIRKNGAEFFVNLTNDVWFPETRLPQQHLELSRVRSVENGVMTLRSCNRGETVVIDPLGHLVARCLDKEGVIVALVPLRARKTVYLLWGDSPILVVSALFLALAGGRAMRKKMGNFALDDCSKKTSALTFPINPD